MSATYQIAYFLPYPSLGWKLPIAARVQTETGSSWVIAPCLPPPDYVGGNAAWELMMSFVDDIRMWAPEDVSQLSPKLRVEFAGNIPASVEDPVSWVQSRLPQCMTKEEPLWKRAARDLALVHISDGDELGILARMLLDVLGAEGKPVDIPETDVVHVEFTPPK